MTQQDNKVVCIYHHPCHDGFTAAWIFKKRMDEVGQEVEFIPMNYDERDKFNFFSLCDAHVYILDFSFIHSDMLHIAELAKKIIIIDHHKTTQEKLVNLPDNVQCIFDMNKSGAMLTWLHFFPKISVPQFLLYIQDRDLWLFEYDDTKAFHEGLLAYAMTFNMWDRLVLSSRLRSIIQEGKAILDYRASIFDKIIDDSLQDLFIGGYTHVPTVNAPYAWSSDICAKLLDISRQPVAAAFFITKEGGYKFSLRSLPGSKYDVSEVAKLYGGGGHKHSAGFYVDNLESLKG